MPTAAERQAVAFLATVALLGGGVRMLQARAFERALDQADAQSLTVNDSAALTGDGRARIAPAAQAFERQLAAVDSARNVRRSKSSKARAPTGPIDPDVATADELESLPRVGPALAARIIADRDSLGPFGSLDALQRVKGIGPALAQGIAPHVTFSSGLRPLHGATSVPKTP